jgi:hypothetical protein
MNEQPQPSIYQSIVDILSGDIYGPRRKELAEELAILSDPQKDHLKDLTLPIPIMPVQYADYIIQECWVQQTGRPDLVLDLILNDDVVLLAHMLMAQLAVLKALGINMKEVTKNYATKSILR